METMTAPWDYIKYLEHPALLMNAEDETLRFFVGDHGVVKRAVAHAITIIKLDVESGEPTMQSPKSQRFLNWFFSNLTCREVLFESFDEIDGKEIAHHFMNMAISFPCISRAMIVDIFSSFENIINWIRDVDVFGYSYAYRWLEHGVLRRANFLLEGAPNREFELNHLIPIAMNTVGRSLPAVYGVSRSIAGAAFDAGQLSKESIDILLDVFPGDHYFETRLRELPRS